MSLLTFLIECNNIIDNVNNNKIWKYHEEKDLIINNSKNKMNFIIQREFGEENQEKVNENFI